MAKNINPEQERMEQEFRNRINGMAQERASKIGEQVKEAMTKAAENVERNRKKKMAREVGLCFFAAACIAGLYLAETAGLISPILADPMSAAAFVSIGWHLCKAGNLKGRK